MCVCVCVCVCLITTTTIGFCLLVSFAQTLAPIVGSWVLSSVAPGLLFRSEMSGPFAPNNERGVADGISLQGAQDDEEQAKRVCVSVFLSMFLCMCVSVYVCVCVCVSVGVWAHHDCYLHACIHSRLR